MAEKKDITGLTFGYWSVISFSHCIGVTKYWKCKCECGTEKCVAMSNLTTGKSTNCGCKRHILPNLIGNKIGKLLVIKKITCKNGVKYLCKCDCGNNKIVSSTHLYYHNTLSCGCLQRESTIKRSTIHGKHSNDIYYIWVAIKQRCYNPNNIAYKNYGLLGVKVCDRWMNSFENFISDMGNRPSDKYSIDRIDPTGNYEPSNCRWATMKEQCNNKRKNIYIEYNGENHTISEWSDITGINYKTIHSRYARGLSPKDIFYNGSHSNINKLITLKQKEDGKGIDKGTTSGRVGKTSKTV